MSCAAFGAAGSVTCATSTGADAADFEIVFAVLSDVCLGVAKGAGAAGFAIGAWTIGAAFVFGGALATGTDFGAAGVLFVTSAGV
jgi:hypothetical protein